MGFCIGCSALAMPPKQFAYHAILYQVPATLKLAAMVSEAAPSFAFLLGMEAALRYVNTSTDLLVGTELVVELLPAPTGDLTIGGAEQVLTDVRTAQASAMLTSADSTTSIPLASAAATQLLPVVSSTSTLAKLGDASSYPYFVRVVPPDSQQALALLDLCLRCVLLRLCPLHCDGLSLCCGSALTRCGVALACCVRYGWLHVATVYDPDNVYSTGLEEDFVKHTNAAGIQVRLCSGTH